MTDPRPSLHLSRPRLTRRMVGATRIVVEAGLGYGKTSLAYELAAELDVPPLHVEMTPERRTMRDRLAEAAQRVGLPRLATTIHTADADPASLAAALGDHGGPLLVVLDDVQELDDADLLRTLVTDVASPQRPVMVLGRRVPAGAVPQPDAVQLGLDDLALSTEEVRELLRRLRGCEPTPEELTALMARTGGWATMVLASAAVGDEAVGPSAQVLDQLVATLDEQDLPAIVDLAHLPMVSPYLARAVGGGDAWDRALRAGLPIRRLHGPWSRIANPLQEHLAAMGSLRPQTVRLAAAAYARAGELPAGLRLLDAHAAAGDRAAFLGAASDEQLVRWLGPDLLDVLDGLPDDVLATEPAPLLAASFLCGVIGETERRRRVAERMDRVVAHDHPARPLVEAELASNQSWLLEAGEPVRQRVLEIVEDPDAPPRARARAWEVMGLNHWLFAPEQPDPMAAFRAMASPLTRAADLWRQLGEPIRAVWPLTWRAVASEWNCGSYLRALRSLDEARALAVGRPLVEVFVVPFRAMILSEIGRYDEAEEAIAEARALAAACRSRSRAAYASWAAARMASQRGDAEAALVLVHEAESLGARDSGGGAFFAADAAQILARVGKLDEAHKRLSWAVEHDPSPERRFVPIAQITLAAREGDFDTAWELHERCFVGADHERELLDPRDHPRVLLLLAHAAHVQGHHDRAATLAMEAFEEGARFDVPGVLLVREPDIARELLPIAAERGSAAARQLVDRGITRLRLLGGFSIERIGQAPETPTGVVAQVLKVIATKGGRVSIDQLIDAVWPDADTALGRQRLRSVLRRIRDEVGPDLVQRDGDGLVFGAGVSIDATEFDAASSRALRERDIGAAETALSLHGGELLPDDRYEPWAEQERRRLEWRWLAVLDLLVEVATEAGDLPRAQQLLLLAIDAQPEVDDRYVRSAELHLRQGRPGRARAVLERAVAELDGQGFEPSVEVARLLDRLRG